MHESFDYIIVGGGSAGCVLANRLSEDPEVNVCLLEAGGSHKSLFVKIPMAVIAMVAGKFKNWAFQTVPQKGLNNRTGYQPRGKTLGGSSSTNAMIYIRGHKADYNSWAALGNKGWSYNDVLPYFKKSENWERGANDNSSDYHGVRGPLNVAPVTDPAPLNNRLIEAAKSMQIPINDDFNGTKQEGIGLYEVTQKNGERCDAARAFLDPVEGRVNLKIITGVHVEKIIIEDGVATGVSYLSEGKSHQVNAQREVILCAGAFGSPQILLLSGIGPADKLKPHGITQVQDLPGVGENLQDHIDWIGCFKSRSPDTFGISLMGGVRLFREAVRYLISRRGMLATNYAESGGFLYTDRNEPSPDIQLHFVRAMVENHGRNLSWGHGYSCHVCVLRPKSRGRLSLKSADPLEQPLIDPAFLEDDRDMETLLRGIKMAQDLLLSPAFDGVRGNAKYASASRDDEELRADIRARADTIYHPVGTCKMGNDPMAVVDDRLRIHNIKGLRVIDASIMPNLVSGNTNAPSIMIAEKGADLIKEDARFSALS